MGGKPRIRRRRAPSLRITFNEEEAREIYDRFCKQYVGQEHTMTFLRILGRWLDSLPNPKQLELPGTKDG